MLLFVFLGCNKKVTNEEFEQNIFDELFVSIVDSTYKDQRLYTCFPEQGKPIYDKKGNWIGLDTVGQHQRDLECKIKRIALSKDTINLVIALGNEGLINEKTDLNKYKSSKFIFKHLSEYPRENDYEYNGWKAHYSKFAGAMSFSKINFNTKKDFGIIKVWYSCGGRCGLGYSVYIKKIKNKWIINKVEETSIA